MTVKAGLNVELRPIHDLSVDPENLRSHSERNIEAIKASLREFGQQKPIVVNDSGEVVAGNGTLEAAKQLGWHEISAVTTDLRGARAVAFSIADNRTAELASWSDELGDALAALRDDPDIDELVTGFNQQEFAELIEDGSDLVEVKELDLSSLEVDFWISVRGKIASQPEVIELLANHLRDIPGVLVDVGLVGEVR